ncbi:uncharacterized protein LOC144569681 isoform X2 [Carex rostrata]
MEIMMNYLDLEMKIWIHSTDQSAYCYLTLFVPLIGKSETNCGVNSKRFIRKWELSLVTNFESDKSAAYYANMYKRDSLTGGHVIMLGVDPLSQVAALEGLHAYPEWKILTEMAKV